MQRSKQPPKKACDYCRLKKIRCNSSETWPRSCNQCKDKWECTHFEAISKQKYSASYVRKLEEKIARYESILSNRDTSQNNEHDKEKDDDFDSDVFEDALANQQRQLTEFGKVQFMDSMNDVLNKVKAYNQQSNSSLFNKRRLEYWFVHENEEDSYMAPYTDQDFGNDHLMYHFVGIYFQKVNSTFPLLNRSLFLQQIPRRKLERKFASVLILVCALGALYCNDKGVLLPNMEPQDFLAGSSYLQIYKMKAPNYTLSATNLLDVQALILFQMYIQRSSHLQSSMNLNSSALSISLDIGLHQFSKFQDPVQREGNKRAFFCIYMMDRSLSAAFGRRTMLKDKDFEFELPQPLIQEVGFREGATVLYFSHMIKLYQILGEINHLFGKPRKLNEKSNMSKSVAGMSSRLNQWLEEVPEQLKYNANIQDDLIFQLMSNLRIAFYNIQISMYRKFVPHPRSTKYSKFKIQSLMICTNAARSMLSLFNTMELERLVVQNFIDFFMNFGPFNALVILILSVCESRRTDAVDQSDIRYIELGIDILRRREIKDIVAGKTLDVILHLLDVCQLKVKVSKQRRLSDDYRSPLAPQAISNKVVIDNNIHNFQSQSLNDTEEDDILNNVFNVMQTNPMSFEDNMNTMQFTQLNNSSNSEWNQYLASVFQQSITGGMDLQ